MTRLTEDVLFLAVTRPAMWFGVPLEASLPIAMSSVLTLIFSGNPLYAAGYAGAAFAAARLIARHDAQSFRLLMLWSNSKGRCINRLFWGGSSYSPLPVGGIKRRGFAHG